MVVNQSPAIPRTIGDYYVLLWKVPLVNIRRIRVAPDEQIARAEYDRSIGAYLHSRHLEDQILSPTSSTLGVPLRIFGDSRRKRGRGLVDSDLALDRVHGVRSWSFLMIRDDDPRRT